MNIYIDESGTFVSAPTKCSWNVVVALVVPESSRKDLQGAIRAIKLATRTSLTDEAKLGSLTEEQYLCFLGDIERTRAILFCTATDAGLNDPARLLKHQQMLVAKIRESIPRMKYDGGKQGRALLADQLEVIPPQLYAQLVCQVDLLHDVILRSINYFAQRIPGTLSAFRWRIDQKNTSKTVFEEAFEKIAPELLQERSFREPIAKVEGFDYRRMIAYEYAADNIPKYLQADYGVNVKNALNIGKLIRDDLKFEDSRSSVGIQAVDLLASGFRRCLRGQFLENHEVAVALGRLTLQNKKGMLPIRLVSFSEEDGDADQTASSVIKAMARESKKMFAS